MDVYDFIVVAVGSGVNYISSYGHGTVDVIKLK